MRELFAVIRFAFEYWFVFAYFGAVIGAYVIGGRKLAIAFATLGGAVVAYRIGGKHKQDNLEAHYREVSEKREKAYEDIENRGTDRGAVSDRLHDNTY